MGGSGRGCAGSGGGLKGTAGRIWSDEDDGCDQLFRLPGEEFSSTWSVPFGLLVAALVGSPVPHRPAKLVRSPLTGVPEWPVQSYTKSR